MHELARATDMAHVDAIAPPALEMLLSGRNWMPKWILEKREGNWSAADIEAGLAPAPYETVEVEGNLLLTAGITELWKRLTGIGGTAFSQVNSYVYVGDNSTNTADDAGRTDLAGASKSEAQCDAGYPTVSTNRVTWKATFDGTAGNHAWKEVGVKNGAGAPSGAVILLNRKLQDFGVKASGATWTMTLQIDLA
jgi:hypothetical protein